jgi:hypothetical protein
MEEIKNVLREQCLISPHWMQLELQGFWYGLLSWLITCREDNREAKDTDMSVRDILLVADKEFDCWPTDWLEETKRTLIQQALSLENLHQLFNEIDLLFRDCIPTDLDIFTTLGEGNELTMEQWERLYDGIAIQPATRVMKRQNKRGTKRVHGRRGITPLRHKRAITHHRQPTMHYNFIRTPK